MMRIVPAFNEIEHYQLRLYLRLEMNTIAQVALGRSEEALTHRVVIAAGHRAHGALLASVPSAQPGPIEVYRQPWSEW